MIAFAVLSIFTSSEISQVHGHRLVRNDVCGYRTLDPSLPFTQRALYLLNDTYHAATYAQECYLGNPSSLRCGFYVRPFLESSYNVTAECPFAPGTCQRNADGSDIAVQFEVLDLSSDTDFGINTAKEARLEFGKRTTCTPVNITQDNLVTRTLTEDGNIGTAGDKVFEYCKLRTRSSYGIR